MIPFKWFSPIFLALLFAAFKSEGEATRSTMDLNGAWQFQLDPQNEGEGAGWYSQITSFTNKIQIPGCWQAQGFGEPLGILRNSYCGPAWYRREVNIPRQWKDRTITLHVGAAFRQVELFVNGVHAGDRDGFCTGFQFDITDYVKPGSENTLVFRVNNPGQVITNSGADDGPYAPTGTMNYLGNWGGIFGNVWLETTDQTAITKTRITPDLEHERAAFKITVVNKRQEQTPMRVNINLEGGKYKGSAEFAAEATSTNEVELTVDMPGAHRWTPDTPFLYTATISLEKAGREIDRVKEKFGMREITTRGDVLLLNGQPFYLRAYGDDSIWVRDGVPPASREFYVKQLRLTKSYGFNAIRFHSSVPVSELFEAADEVGMLIMAELPAAYSRYFMPFSDFYKTELARVLDVYHNHPSFLSLAFGDELLPSGTTQQQKAYVERIGEFYRYAKKLDPQRLILSNDGYRLQPSDMESTWDWVLREKGSLHIPFILHEFGQYYCSLPDLSLRDKFDGVMIPTWLAPKEQWIKTNGLASAYEKYVSNSQKLLNVGRKYQIEAARRNPGITGYEYWLITDFPGGGGEGDSWDEGWFDYFWRAKQVTPEDGRMLNSPVLMMLDPGVTKATLWSDSPKDFKVWISNYGDKEIHDGRLCWQLKCGRKILAESQCNDIDAGLGKVAMAAKFKIPATNGKTAQKLELVLTLKAGRDTFVNRWDLWSFPHPSHDDSVEGRVITDVTNNWLSKNYPTIEPGARGCDKIWLTQELDSGAVQYLQDGGSVFFLAGANGAGRKPDAQFFPGGGDGLGTLITRHPALRGFPNDGFCDLQFYHLITGGHLCEMDGAPVELMPIIGGIGTTADGLSKEKDLSKFAYIFEVRVGKGKMLVCSLRLAEGIAEGRPEALFLFDRLLRYVAGNEFAPKVQANQTLVSNFLHGE